MTDKVAVTEDDLKGILAASPFAQIYGFKLRSIRSGECVVIVPFQEALERPGGIVSGAVFMAAADVAMWLAIMTRVGKDAASVSSELNTAFLNSARREDVHCAARILKLGKTLIYGVAQCTNEAGKLLTHHTVTYVRVDEARKRQ